MKCQGCTKCCEFLLIRINEPANADYQRWAKFHNVEVITIGINQYAKINNKCEMLQGDGCSIHLTKPELCRKFDCDSPDFKAFKPLLYAKK